LIKSGCREAVVKNDLNRKIAIILGVLFIFAIIAGVIIDTSGADVSINEIQGVMGTPFEFALAIAVVGMPILMYPILKKYKLSMALGFVGGPLAIRNWGYGMVAPIVFSTGSLMFFYLLYKSKLIPRWLSGWGLIGATLFLASAFLPLLSYVPSATLVFLHLTGAVNQMVLAVWLIVKGFNSSAIAQSEKPEIK
jgi:Domain of unknown function (DUF4386)